MPLASPGALERSATVTTPGTKRAIAATFALALVAAGVLAVRFGDRFLGENDAVFAAANAGAFVAMLVSATISRNQFKATGLPTLAVLSNIFGISAMVLVAFVAVVPHVFSPPGLGSGEKSAVWLWSVGRALFAFLVLGYVACQIAYRNRVISGDDAYFFGRRVALAAVTISLGIVGAVFALHAVLPSLGDANGFSPLFRRFVEPALTGLDAIALVAIVGTTRLRQTTGTWLGLMVLASGIQTVVAGHAVHGAFTLGWYVVFVVGAVVQAVYLVVQLRNANDQLAAYAEDKKILIEETLRDPLTNLLNRRGFDERFEDILTESRLCGKPASVLIFDIDHFKAFNDAFGHPAGDDAIKNIADCVVGVINRPSDACCRIGGEEFAIVLGDTDASGAMTVAERLRANVMRLRLPQDPDYSKMLTVSVGTATAYPSIVITPTELYERADKALYKAKRMGRNRIATHDAKREGDLQPV